LSQPSLYEHMQRLFRPGKVDFIYRYGHDTCCADVFFSDGVQWWYWDLSNILGDALQAMISGLARIVRYETDAQVDWLEEPGGPTLLLHREGDVLHITVRSRSHWTALEPSDPVDFRTMVDFWTFVQRVRLAASRVAAEPAGDKGKHVSFEDDRDYQELCDRLADRHRR
jgi:hypothetical protein